MSNWVNIDGYSGDYSVNESGDIKSNSRRVTTKLRSYLSKEKIMKPQMCGAGYLQIALRKGGEPKQFLVHRVVAKAFIPNPENKLQVNHKNGIKTDNRVENLEWVTRVENSIHSIRVLNNFVPKSPDLKGAKNKRSKPVVCLNTGVVYESAGDAARKLNMYQGNISRICRGECAQENGLSFKYI